MRDETADIYARVHHRVDEIMHYIWDPIGVAGTPGARDEYDGYVADVVRMLFDGANADHIAGHLKSIESGSMGLSQFFGGDAKTRRAAELLIEHYHWISQPR